MGCGSCGGGSGSSSGGRGGRGVKWRYVKSDGSHQDFLTETEAQAAKRHDETTTGSSGSSIQPVKT